MSTDAPEPPERPGPSVGDRLIYLVGVFGLSASITAIWLGMRAVMDIGGSCGSGGPYEIAVPCPPAIDLVMLLAFPLGFLSAGLMIWKGAALGGSWVGLVALAWPALFLSLGWNFIEYGIQPPGGGGAELGWLLPGVLFLLMGAIPLAAWIGARGHGPVIPGLRASTTPIELRELRDVMRATARSAARGAAAAPGSMTVAEATRRDREATARDTSARGLVPQLERLAALHAAGELDDAQYEAAKVALIGAASRGEL